MKKLLILLFFILIFGSCTTNYFLCETAGPVKLYYNPQIQKSGETKTKGSKSGKNPEKSQFQAVIEI